MVRVLTRKARKDYPQQGIKKGDTYYKWSFFRQRPHLSKTPPTRAQLTQNENLATVYNAYDIFDGDVSALISSLEEARDGEQEKLDNLPEGFQQGDVGQQIQERIDTIEASISDLEELNSKIEEEEGIELPPKPANEDDVERVLEDAAIDLEYHEVDYPSWTLKRLDEAISQAVGETEPEI